MTDAHDRTDPLTEGEERGNIVLRHQPRDNGLVESPDLGRVGLSTAAKVLLTVEHTKEILYKFNITHLACELGDHNRLAVLAVPVLNVGDHRLGVGIVEVERVVSELGVQTGENWLSTQIQYMRTVHPPLQAAKKLSIQVSPRVEEVTAGPQSS